MKSKRLKTVTALLPLLGIIFGIVLGFACKVDVSDDWWTEELSFNVGLMFETWMFFDLLALFFGWLASVLEKLENIERNICGENSASDKGKPLKDCVQNVTNCIHSKLTNEPSKNEWKCPKCGKTNQNYVGTCACGEVKPERKEKQDLYTWVCPECGKANKSTSDVDTCSCGYSPLK